MNDAATEKATSASRQVAKTIFSPLLAQNIGQSPENRASSFSFSSTRTNDASRVASPSPKSPSFAYLQSSSLAKKGEDGGEESITVQFSLLPDEVGAGRVALIYLPFSQTSAMPPRTYEYPRQSGAIVFHIFVIASKFVFRTEKSIIPQKEPILFLPKVFIKSYVG